MSVCPQFGHDLTGYSLHAIKVWAQVVVPWGPGSFPKVSGYGEGSVCDYRTQNLTSWRPPAGHCPAVFSKWQFASSRPTGNCLCCSYSLRLPPAQNLRPIFRGIQLIRSDLPKREDWGCIAYASQKSRKRRQRK